MYIYICARRKKTYKQRKKKNLSTATYCDGEYGRNKKNPIIKHKKQSSHRTRD